MMNSIGLVWRYLKYRLKAKSAHGIHSPFVYSFITEILQNNTPFYAFGPLEAYRVKLQVDPQKISVEDHGAGSRRFGKITERSIGKIAQTSVKPAKYAQLLFRIVNAYQPKNIVELGTSLGLTTLYLSFAHEKGMVYTLEGDVATGKEAQKAFIQFGRTNIKLISGIFENTLPRLLNELAEVHFAYIDGHHTSEATLINFELLRSRKTSESVFVIDDIHWSPDMETAWEKIKAHKDVSLSIDLFEMGLVFFEKRPQKEHFILRF